LGCLFQKSFPSNSHLGEFSGDEADFSSSSSIMISTARQLKLQNAFSPLQDIKGNQY